MRTLTPTTKSSRGLVRARRLATALVAAAITVPAAPVAALAAVPVQGATPPAGTAVRQAMPAAVAVGKLAPGGCTPGATAGTQSCDLYAMEGTNQINGVPTPIWGFSTTGVAGSATAPGPVLVVNQGDTVTVTLHNTLPQNVSLAFPGQQAADFSAGLSATAETTGAATGATETYTFTASRAGTFLYEAGHTPDGARQVAMGLAGALVVLDPAGTAYGNAYDDEAVLVLSEVDPALNAAPLTFDMRSFRPRYRLINGKAFPSTDPVATDQGHTVLLRYVNAGSVEHSMSLLGADQLQLSDDGHARTFPEREIVASVASGQTADTLVTMPTGPESKVTLYEQGGHLDNNGQTELDPAKLATGGMMTFLDTAAPAPSTDAVGPKSQHISLAPNPSDGLTDVTITADLTDVKSGNANVDGAEFVVDDATTVAAGSGIPMTGAFGTPEVAGATGTIPATADCTPVNGVVPVALSCLEAGKHKVYVRAHDANGNWGVIGSAVLNLPKTGPATHDGSLDPNPANGDILNGDVAVTATGDDSAADGNVTDAEYFVDTFTGDGTGTAMTTNGPATVVSVDGVIPAATVNGLTEGTHHVLVHVKDSLGLWGPTLDIPLVIDMTGPTVDAASVGPNPTNGQIDDPGNPGNLVVSAQITDRDAQQGLQSNLADAEGFLDPADAANPTPGSGFSLVAEDGTLDSPSETVYGLIPISEVTALDEGTHKVYVRGMDAAGNWGPMFGVDLVVDRTAPVLGAVTASPDPTGTATELTLTAPVNETGITIGEFWTGDPAADPGEGNATEIAVVDNGDGTLSAVVPLGGIVPGAVVFNLRVQDAAGNWSNLSSTAPVTVDVTNLLMRDSFAKNLRLWSGRFGKVSVTNLAGIPATGGNRGLQATTVRGSTRGAYVVDNRPVAERAYHARFAFKPGSVLHDAGRAVITVFDARTRTGSTVFAVQVRHHGAGFQIRSVMSRTGAKPVAGRWVALSRGGHTVRVDWAAGRSRGSLRLLVDARTATRTTGVARTLRIESVRLGVVSGVTSHMAGAAYFDDFTSARHTLR